MSDVIDFQPRLRIVSPPALPTSAHDQAQGIALRIEAQAMVLERLCRTPAQRYTAEMLTRVARTLARLLDNDSPPGGAAA